MHGHVLSFEECCINKPPLKYVLVSEVAGVVVVDVVVIVVVVGFVVFVDFLFLPSVVTANKKK